MSTVPQKLSPEQQLSRWLQDRGTLDRIDELLCGVMSAEAYIGSILLALNDQKLSKCTTESKYAAAFKCATMGFIPNLSHVALHESNNKKVIDGRDTWVKEVRVTPQWQGYKAIMERHPEILEVQAVIVFNHEELIVQNGEVTHSYDPLDERRVVDTSIDMANVRGGYTKIVYRDRTRPAKYHFTTIDHIRKSRKCAETDKLWQAWTDRMVLKTLYRDCWSNRAVPIDPIHAKQMKAVLEHDDSDMGNNPSRLEAKQTPAIDAKPRSRGQALLENLPQPMEYVVEPPQQTLEHVSPEKAEEKPRSVRQATATEMDAHKKFADLAKALDGCGTDGEVDSVMSNLPEYLDDLSRPATDEANRMAVARKMALA